MNATGRTRHLRAWMTLAALVLQIAGVGGAALAASPAGSLSVATDHSSYAASPSSTVTISGTVTAATPAVGLEVDGPSGNVWDGQPTPNANGAFSDTFTLSASDPAGTYTVYATANVQGGTLAATATFTVTSQTSPAPGALTIQTTSLPAGTAGTAYGPVTLTASGGGSPPSYTWSVSPGLPAGLQLTTLSDGGGQISGTPTSPSSTSLTFQVKDAAGATATRTMQLIVGAPTPGALAIQTTSLPAGTVGTSYGPATLTASGGGSAPSYTWSVSPALPAGLQLTTLADGDGQISGTPTGASATILTFQVKDAAGATATQTMELIVAPAGVNVTGPSLQSASATLGSLTVTGNSGSGSIGLAGYSGDPGGAATFNASGLYFNIALSPGNTFQTLTVNDCALPTASPSLYWWNTSATPPAWQPVQPLSSPAESVTPDPSHSGDYCLTLTLASGSQPNLADLLTGTAFAVSVPTVFTGGGGGGGFAPSSGSGGAIPVAVSVGSSGGTLTTSDGLCSINVPAGAIPSGSTLTISDSTTVPTNLPSGLVVLSPVCTLSGAGLTPPQPVTITFDPAKLNGLSTQRASVYVETSGGWKFAPTSIAGTADTATAYASGPESMIVLGNVQRFSDVPAGFWAKGDIDALLAGLVVNGFPNGTFQPNGDLTRAQFVKMLVLALGLAPGSGNTPFTDVPAGAWFAPYVSAAVQAGIVQGLSATTFGPNDPVTREQMAVLLARALKLTGTATLTFTDAASIAPWAQAGVEAAVKAGYISGFPNGTFQPLGPTTRAQAAKVLALAIAHMAP